MWQKEGASCALDTMQNLAALSLLLTFLFVRKFFKTGTFKVMNNSTQKLFGHWCKCSNRKGPISIFFEKGEKESKFLKSSGFS